MEMSARRKRFRLRVVVYPVKTCTLKRGTCQLRAFNIIRYRIRGTVDRDPYERYE